MYRRFKADIDGQGTSITSSATKSQPITNRRTSRTLTERAAANPLPAQTSSAQKSPTMASGEGADAIDILNKIRESCDFEGGPGETFVFVILGASVSIDILAQLQMFLNE